MTNVEDFTLFPRGSEIPLVGRVEACPLCGRNGIEEHPMGGHPYFVHLQITEVLADGMRSEPLDCCKLKEN